MIIAFMIQNKIKKYKSTRLSTIIRIRKNLIDIEPVNQNINNYYLV